MHNKPSYSFFDSPSSMEPLFPEDLNNHLEHLAMQLIEKSSKLSGTLNPITRNAIAEFLRPMNSYYSNLIEGHDTHPIDIERALNNDYSNDKQKKDLQLEARAHINVHKTISNLFKQSTGIPIPSNANFLQFIHSEFYNHLPDDLKKSKTISGDFKIVIPGEFRTNEVQVGKHIAPLSTSLPSFIKRFEEFYNPTLNQNKSKLRRVISIAASHHRLSWIHPFLDGNGRVTRLFSDALFMYENLHSEGLWSISRGLARTNTIYKTKLANADLGRYNDYDGRGNLSNKMLEEFCVYFLETAIDQIDFMYKTLDTGNMVDRIHNFVDLMVQKGKLKFASKYILTDLFLNGKISKKEAMRITNTSDKTLKLIIDYLMALNLVVPKKEGINMMYYINYPISSSPLLFPGLYPTQKELDMM